MAFNSVDTDPMLGRVLVIDDHAPNRQLLREVLEARGYRVDEAADATPALIDGIGADPPDVVLCDVMLPTIDGIQLCQRLKDAPATAALPLILVTANADRRVRLAGIDAGADDFLTKPLDTQDVALRVRNAMRTRRLYQRTRAALEQLQQLQQMREELTNLVVHDLRSPLGNVRNYLELWLLKSPEPPASDLRRFIEIAFAQTGTVIDQIGSLLDISRLEADGMPLIVRNCPLADLLDRPAAMLQATALAKDVAIEADHGGLMCKVDVDLLVRAVTNLLANAIRHAPAGSVVRLVGARVGSRVRITVIDHGPGVPITAQPRLFTRFGTIDPLIRAHSSGFGLYLCALVAKAHRGKVGMLETPGGGASFWIEVPEGEALPSAMPRMPGQPLALALEPRVP